MLENWNGSGETVELPPPLSWGSAPAPRHKRDCRSLGRAGSGTSVMSHAIACSQLLRCASHQHHLGGNGRLLSPEDVVKGNIGRIVSER